MLAKPANSHRNDALELKGGDLVENRSYIAFLKVLGQLKDCSLMVQGEENCTALTFYPS